MPRSLALEAPFATPTCRFSAVDDRKSPLRGSEKTPDSGDPSLLKFLRRRPFRDPCHFLARSRGN